MEIVKIPDGQPPKGVQDSWSRVFIDSQMTQEGLTHRGFRLIQGHQARGRKANRAGADTPDRLISFGNLTPSNIPMDNPQKKKAQTLQEWQKARMKQANPEVAHLVSLIEAEQDKDAGKQSIRGRLAVGGKVVCITLVGFEQLELRGQWVPSMTYIRGSETTEQLVEEVEGKGAELPPEQKTVDKEETA